MTPRYRVFRSGEMSSTGFPSRCAFSRPVPSPETRTIDLPVGRPHEVGPLCRLVGGRVRAPGRPFTSKSPTSARSPRGPHANGPGFCTSNKQVSRLPSELSAHAWPPLTKVAVSDPFGLPRVQTGGSGAPEASRATVTEGEPTLGLEDSNGGRDVFEGPDDLGSPDPELQADDAIRATNMAARADFRTGPTSSLRGWQNASSEPTKTSLLFEQALVQVAGSGTGGPISAGEIDKMTPEGPHVGLPGI